jgi:hypothetical protein
MFNQQLKDLGSSMTKRTGNALSAILAVVFMAVSIGAYAESHVRIIRLSYIDGSVQMDRATGEGLERAILNTPVTEGVRLATGNDGLAEVEFENNSTVRLGENSEVRFTKLVVNDAGAKVNEVELVKGTVYFDTKGAKDEIYRADVGDSSFLIHRNSEARLSNDSEHPTIAVLKGEAELQTSARDVNISRRETLTVDPDNPAGYEIAKGVDAGPLDQWNNERSAYQTAYSYNAGAGPNLNGYSGYSDLNYYGGWSYLPGVGYGWQPYGVDSWLGWNPYLAGAWAFYPGFGYTWASAYPWGWLPYHYGTWTFLGGGAGWFWVPGPGTFYRNPGWYYSGFQTAPIVHGPAGWLPPRPPALPGTVGSAPTVKVGTIGNMPAAIPGGRMPPNFQSLVPGRTAAASSAFLAGKPGSAATAGASRAQLSGMRSVTEPPYNGHVFLRPSHTPTPAGTYAPWTGGGYGEAMGHGSAAGASHSMGSVSGSHATVAAGSHGGGGHGSPR